MNLLELYYDLKLPVDEYPRQDQFRHTKHARVDGEDVVETTYYMWPQGPRAYTTIKANGWTVATMLKSPRRRLSIARRHTHNRYNNNEPTIEEVACLPLVDRIKHYIHLKNVYDEVSLQKEKARVIEPGEQIVIKERKDVRSK